MALPFISIYAKGEALSKNTIYNDATIYFEGKISKNYKFTTSGNLELTLNDVTILLDEGETKLNGTVVIYTNPENLDLTKFTIGTYLAVRSKLTFINLQTNVKDSLYYISKDIVASGYTAFYNIEVTDKVSLSVRDKIRLRVYELLNDANVDYADVGYAMLFGDSNVLDGDVKASFRATGIAHLLAVSGLHVSIIVMLINFILRKLKINFKINLAFSLLFLMIYCYLCDFSVSVIRASLMAIFSLYASVRGKAYDNLSVLALIAILVLLINPVEMFNVSFVLSFSAVLSIILLMKPLSRIFNKVFYGKLAETLALNFAVQIGLVVTNLYYFGTFPVFGILANLVAVPIATVAFMILAFGSVLSLIFPFMSFVNHGFGMLMSVVVKFNNLVSGVGLTLTAGTFSFLPIILMFALMFLASDYVFLKRRYKLVGCSALAIAVLCLLVI